MKRAPVFKDLVLAGGGHAHALLLRMWAMRPLPGVRLTLVSPEPLTPYSGMLPGLIAGHYGYHDIHIDLARLCQRAGARLLLDSAVGLDPEGRQLALAGHPPLAYDLLSLDIGSTPDTSVPGVAEHAVPIKPIAGFHRRWQDCVARLREGGDKPWQLVVAGGGAGSVEAVLAMAWAVRHDPLVAPKPELTLLTAAPHILPGYPQRVIREAEAACKDLGVALVPDFPVARVNAGRALRADGLARDFDLLFWCTHAGAPAWLAASGLATDAAGFVRVNAGLQSLNAPTVFAAGDIANFDPRPLPKAGVYAVRAAPWLLDNLRRCLLERPLRAWHPQKRFLSLLSLGGRRATGSRGRLSVAGQWVWRWKDDIDRRFMRRFTEAPGMPRETGAAVPEILIPPEERGEILDAEARCCGCGGKIGIGVLAEVLEELTGAYRPEDASVSEWPAGELVQSIDQIRAPLIDPFLFGRIAVFHALNDLYAVNARPLSLQVAVSLPFAGRAAQKRELRQLLQGVLSACRELNVRLLGGHSAEGEQMALAVSVNGRPGMPAFAKEGARPGDLLVLGKPLGTGMILAGMMSGRTRGEDLARALETMNRPQDAAARWLAAAQAHACTDVSGFGLMGHLVEMLYDTALTAELFMEDLPVLPGAAALAAEGLRSSLFPQTEAVLLRDPRWQGWREHPLWPVLLDPQTSGGLLAAVAPEHAEAVRRNGFSLIGEVKRC